MSSGNSRISLASKREQHIERFDAFIKKFKRETQGSMELSRRFDFEFRALLSVLTSQEQENALNHVSRLIQSVKQESREAQS